jgi:lipoprotein-anchoring transpeptidase ErfK/SrfK
MPDEMTRKHQYSLPLLAALALFAALWAGQASAHVAGTARAVQATQQLAALNNTHMAYANPDAGSKHLGFVNAERPITGVQTVLPVLRVDPTGTWLLVRLPGRPNSHTGWIKSAGTVAKTTTWHLVVRTASRRVIVFNKGHIVRVFPAIVGKPSTPTPHGEFFVEESVAMPPTAPGAPVALALSARSHVFQEFEGGPGQIAMHGLSNVGGVLGTAVSHGCIRLADSTVRWLGNRINPGTPVTIKS